MNNIYNNLSVHHYWNVYVYPTIYSFILQINASIIAWKSAHAKGEYWTN